MNEAHKTALRLVLAVIVVFGRIGRSLDFHHGELNNEFAAIFSLGRQLSILLTNQIGLARAHITTQVHIVIHPVRSSANDGNILSHQFGSFGISKGCQGSLVDHQNDTVLIDLKHGILRHFHNFLRQSFARHQIRQVSHKSTKQADIARKGIHFHHAELNGKFSSILFPGLQLPILANHPGFSRGQIPGHVLGVMRAVSTATNHTNVAAHKLGPFPTKEPRGGGIDHLNGPMLVNLKNGIERRFKGGFRDIFFPNGIARRHGRVVRVRAQGVPRKGHRRMSGVHAIFENHVQHALSGFSFGHGTGWQLLGGGFLGRLGVFLGGFRWMSLRNVFANQILADPIPTRVGVGCLCWWLLLILVGSTRQQRSAAGSLRGGRLVQLLPSQQDRIRHVNIDNGSRFVNGNTGHTLSPSSKGGRASIIAASNTGMFFTLRQRSIGGSHLNNVVMIRVSHVYHPNFFTLLQIVVVAIGFVIGRCEQQDSGKGSFGGGRRGGRRRSVAAAGFIRPKSDTGTAALAGIVVSCLWLLLLLLL
mmetsp:Transcript_11392/g.25357  ORF Transcript_11392/g.25357 Transcript_11392/m.25357 type:complete len:531 (+) Transcript_11392:1088-2680(+)